MESVFDETIDKGIGPVIVFEHGTLMDATMFDPQIDHLSDLGYRCISHNSRVLTGKNVPHNLADLADDTKCLLDKLELPKVVLAGMSVGAFAALDFALKYPNRLDGLVLVAGKASCYSEQQQKDLRKGFERCDIEGTVPREIAEWDAQYCFGKTTFENNRLLVDDTIQKWLKLPARSVWHQVLSWLYKPDQTLRLPELQMPVLILHGEEDAAIDIGEAIPMLHYIPDVTFVKIPGAGHSVNLESPALVNHALEAFLERIYSFKPLTPRVA